MFMTIMSNWKILIFCSILNFGIWGFLLKIVNGRLDWKTSLTYVWLTVFIILFIFCFRKANFGWSKFHYLAILAGFFAAIGTLTFYKALSLGPASLIIPFAGQYILVTVVLCVVLLREPLTFRIVIGIICSIAAIVFLYK